MILTEMPDLPPAPWTQANTTFRKNFYAHWGRENAVVCGQARYAEYAKHTQTLSIKAVTKGTEQYFVDRRRICVDEDSYLILNDKQCYGSLLGETEESDSFCIFFRPGMADEVRTGLHMRPEEVLDTPHKTLGQNPPPGFHETLRPHDQHVTPQLRYLQACILAGERDEQWLEERLQRLLTSLIQVEAMQRQVARTIDAAKAATRAELARRIGWAADYIQSNYADPVTLEDIAKAATLSKFHLIRLFKQYHGVTPHTFLLEKRGRVAKRLLETTDAQIGDIAAITGFGSRWTMLRQLRKQFGLHGQALRSGA
ncbi:MAG: helix-turn-helix domain-containing protein [Burkholderiaceae bacterium]